MVENYLPDIHRMLPQSHDAEKGLLGSILLNPALIDECPGLGITGEAFHIPANAVIFRGMCTLRGSTEPLDIISLTQHLRDNSKLEEAGGVAYVSMLFTFVPTAANATYYGEILSEKLTLRQIIKTCTEYASRCYDEQQDVPMLLDEVERKIFKIAKLRYESGHENRTMRQHVMEAVDRLSALQDKSKPSGLMTGIRSIDRKLGGFQRGEVTVLTAVTSGGKSSLAHNIAAHIGIDLKIPVMLFSFEMNAMWVTNRILCHRARIDTAAMRTGKFNTADFSAFQRHQNSVMEAPIFIEDNPDLSIEDIRGRARRRSSMNPLGLVIVDYIQKVVPTGKGHNMRQREVAQISDGLQKMAMELNVPVLALAQQNPDGEAREARDIAFDAKVVLKIKREDDTKSIEDEPLHAKRSLVVCKNTTGSVGMVPLMFLKNFVTFTDCYETKNEEDGSYGN